MNGNVDDAGHAAMKILEAIQSSHPELIADNMPPSWGMKKLRNALHSDSAVSQCAPDKASSLARLPSTLRDAPVILPPIGARITLMAQGTMVRGVVTGHDSKDGKPVFEYQHDYAMPDGSIIKTYKWAWLEQLLDMDF